MSKQETIMSLVREGIRLLSPSAEACLDANQPWKDYQEHLDTLREAVQKHTQEHEKHLTASQSQSKADTSDSTARSILDPMREWNARNALHEARRAFNDFRDDRWDGILHLRDQLIKGLVAAEVVTYALLSLIIANLSSMSIENFRSGQSAFIVGVAFYIVGSMLGLFGRFFGESDLAGLNADYSLSLVRLFATPIFSGLAGVCGVFIMQVVTGLSQTSHLTPISVTEIFQPTPFNLFTAAAFGLTPNLVMQNLKRMVDSRKPEKHETVPSQPRERNI